MAIDKTIPNRLQTDIDQRLVRPEAGEMTDAQNVMLGEEGANSAGVIKNMLGTTAATEPALELNDAEDLAVIGSVSDSQRGYVYWFVADRNSSGVAHGIYRQNTSANTYELVLKNPGFNFDPDGFVKADVVNAAFQQDGVIQTVLYFTDNRNPPRKINVERALNSAVYDATGEDFDTVVSTCKPAMQGYPSVSFSTDSDFAENNFRDTLYQFATQLIYIDGEESSISGYSELSISRPEIFSTMEEQGFGVSPYLDNVCEITIPVDLQVSDLEKVRLIARDGNGGSFFVVDEFDPDQDLYRQTYGVSKQIYNASTRTYRFYNNALGRNVSNDSVNKIYDNVPLLSAGQSVSGNRLMYSNYTEGRPNVDVDASLTVNYLNDDGAGTGELIRGTGDGLITEENTGFEIDLEVNSTGLSISDDLEAGTIVEFGFDFGLDFKIEGTPPAVNEEPIRFSIVDNNANDSATYYNTANDIIFTRKTSQQTSRVSAVNVLSASTSLGLAFNQLAPLFNDVVVRYKVHNLTLPSGVDLLRVQKEGGDLAQRYLKSTGSSQYMEVTWGFDGYSTGSGTIAIRPYVKTINPATSIVTDDEGTPVSGEVIDAGSDDSILRSGIYTGLTGHALQGALDYYNSSSGSNLDITNYLFGKTASIRTSAFEKTFKSGSSHTFGIVYYDKFNRSGNVNLIGSAYVEPIQSIARSSSQRGACSITVDLSNTTPPDWATSYQIVYAGADSFSNYVQYTTSGGYFKHEHGTAGTSKNPDIHIKEVYLSLNTLDVYNQEKNTSRQYSFTEGDKLRVISSYGTSRNYELSNNSEAIEFDVVGVETANNDIMGSVVSNNYGDIPSDEVGSTVLKLIAPQINGGIDRYQDFDWFDITGTSPSTLTSSAITAENKWGQGTVVEIVTPRKYTEEKVFYEIGHGGTISNGSHGNNPVLTNGDSYFRPISCKTSPDAASVGDLAAMVYRTFYIESNTVSDGFESRDWHRGRPHVVFENSATVRRYNGITYSDAYAEDVANLSLSSFNGSLANFFSLESANGACNYIGTLNDQFLVALQENKMSVVPVDKNILQQSQGGQLSALSTKVLNDPRYYVGDYGCGNNPESVLIRDGQVFFVDASRKKVVRWTSEGLSPISEKGVDSLFQTNLDAFTAQGGARIISGYDPRYDHYYVTLRPTGTFNGLTLGYGAKGLAQGGAWQSRYTFFPDMYVNQDDMMYSALYRPTADTGLDDPTIFYSHDNQLRNSFYGYDAQPSVVQVVSNNSPSMTKVFNALSLEGDSANWVADPIVTDLNSNAQSLGFVEKEGSYYSFITRDENGTKHITGVGRVASFTASQITFENRVNRNSIPYGSNIRGISGSGDSYLPLGSLATDVTFSRFVDPYTIEVEGTINILNQTLVGGEVIAVSEATINGDPVRGHWAEITLTNNQTTAFELYCVNTHIARSKQDHAAGQQ